MKKLMILLSALIAILAFYGFLNNHSAQAQTPTFGCKPISLTVRTGQIFYLTVAVTDTLDLYAWQFDTQYHPETLEWVALIPGNHLRSDGARHYLMPPKVVVSGSTTKEATNAAATRLSKDTGVDGNGVIAYLYFRAIKPKTTGTTVTLNDSMLVDRNALVISKSLVNSGNCKVIISDSAPVLVQPPVGELIFMPTIIR